jgi:twitching motility protein PilT
VDTLPAPADLSLTAFLRAARDAQASDLRLAAGAAPHARVEGVLRRFDLPPLDRDVARNLVDVAARLAGAVVGPDLDVCIDTEAFGRFRVSIHRGRGGVAMTLKCVPPTIDDLDALGLPESLDELTRIRSGLVLVTGPSNSGKSCTLAALLARINGTRREHVITIEEPIEFVFESRLASVTQRQVGRDTETFAAALRAALREDRT